MTVFESIGRLKVFRDRGAVRVVDSEDFTGGDWDKVCRSLELENRECGCLKSLNPVKDWCDLCQELR